MRSRLPVLAALAALLPILHADAARAACCYFTAKDKDVTQPAQKAFITWDPDEKVESFTVQPKFAGNAPDFGMVVPTPGKPKLDEMPRDFFKELAVYTILKQRQFPRSKILPPPRARRGGGGSGLFGGGGGGGNGGSDWLREPPVPKREPVRILEAGIVGSLDYKIIEADRADDLFQWLKENGYSYAGDEAALDHYVKKKWFFTVMKIDAKQMKPQPDGTFDGDVTPTRFQFASDQLVYPLRLTRVSVKDKTEALFYVQAPYKVDLPGDMTYQFQWVPLLQSAVGVYEKGMFDDTGLPGRGGEWLAAIEMQIPDLLRRGSALGFTFTPGKRPAPDKDGREATTLEWARRLTDDDIRVLTGERPYTATVPDVDAGFDPRRLARSRGAANRAYEIIRQRLEDDRKKNPAGHLVRDVPKEDVEKLKVLKGHLKSGQFVTKIRKSFTKDELNDDLLIVPAKLGDAEDKSEYEEILPASPP